MDAGERPELTVSEPRPNAAKLAAVDVPDPFDEPAYERVSVYH